MASVLADYLLPGVPVDRVHAAYAGAAGKELEKGRFFSPESSAVLAANTFGFFLQKPDQMPALPIGVDCGGLHKL